MSTYRNNMELTGRTRIGTTGKLEHEYADYNTLGMRRLNWASETVVNMDMEAAIKTEAVKDAQSAAAQISKEASQADHEARVDAVIAELKAIVVAGATIESLRSALGEFTKPEHASYIGEVIYEVNAGDLKKAIAAIEMC